MNAILQFQLKHSGNRYVFGLTALILVLIGWFCGYKFNLSAGEGIYLNSPYSIGFMMALMSLSIIFLSILYAMEILFKEWDTKFDMMLFSYPITLKSYLIGKFSTFTLKTFLSYSLLMFGFVIGQNLRTGIEMQIRFSLWSYLYPFLIFGVLNCFFVCSVLFMIAYTTRKKLLVVVGGLLLYVLYMVLLVFSNSPFMAGSIPQSIEIQQISSLLDPFGASAYFFESKDLSVAEKNQFIVPLKGFFAINRIVYLALSMLFLVISYRFYVFNKATSKKELKGKKHNVIAAIVRLTKVKTPALNFGFKSELSSIFSFARVDLIYLFKSVTIVAVSMLLVFFVGMEMYSDIDKGIRLPEYYASSGLLATSISQSFHLLGAFILVYFINDLYWRSNAANLYLIEDSTFFSKAKLKGHLISLAVLLVYLTVLLIILALVFQIGYRYTLIDWLAYYGVIIFNTIPLFLFGTLLLLINSILNSKYVALGVSILAVVIFTTPLIKMVLPYPLLHIFSGFNGVFSDMNAYGIYLSAFSNRLLFGICLLGLLWIFNSYLKSKKLTKIKTVTAIILLELSVFGGLNFMNGYSPKNEDAQLIEAVSYENKYHHYKNIFQPTITDVDTKIDLYPSENSYKIQGKYTIQNLTHEPINKILLNFHSDLELNEAKLRVHNKDISINEFVSEVKLNKPLLPNEKGILEFKISYKWSAVNGHQSFNAIVENGSFMRISNYYPVIGYQSDKEIVDEQIRKAYQLANSTDSKPLEAPEIFKNDFINLNMIVSTEGTQTPIGTGDFVKSWSDKGRAFVHHSVNSIPFRFAVASAEYKKHSINHRNITIEVFYDDRHFENVDRLLKNARLSLDYCIDNFGSYPFEKISFVEVSAFTSGFAATAYPSAVFMTENMIFHTNINSDPNKDVINELAGHELSHLWWGNNQINPDEREGASMLTESLAMYTEMMIYKKMYGKERMQERLQIHRQIYDNAKGLYGDTPLYKVPFGATHIAYSKGALVMVELSELLGEDQVNLALKNFLQNNQYPKKPTSLDLLAEFYVVAPDESAKSKIEELFKRK